MTSSQMERRSFLAALSVSPAGLLTSSVGSCDKTEAESLDASLQARLGQEPLYVVVRTDAHGKRIVAFGPAEKHRADAYASGGLSFDYLEVRKVDLSRAVVGETVEILPEPLQEPIPSRIEEVPEALRPYVDACKEATVSTQQLIRGAKLARSITRKSKGAVVVQYHPASFLVDDDKDDEGYAQGFVYTADLESANDDGWTLLSIDGTDGKVQEKIAAELTRHGKRFLALAQTLREVQS